MISSVSSKIISSELTDRNPLPSLPNQSTYPDPNLLPRLRPPLEVVLYNVAELHKRPQY